MRFDDDPDDFRYHSDNGYTLLSFWFTVVRFYLYCVANDDMRKAAVNIIQSTFIYQQLQKLINFVWNMILTR